MSNEQTESLMDFGSVDITSPDTSFSGDTELISHIQQALPKYQGQNSYSLKRKAIDDSNFFNELSTEFFTKGLTNEERELAETDPEWLKTNLGNFQKNLHQSLSKNVYAGQTHKEAIVDRDVQLKDSIDKLPLEQYKSIIKANPRVYREFDLINDEGEFIYDDDEISDRALAKQIFRDDRLKKQLSADSFRAFEIEMTKRHNNPALLADINDKVTAYALFDEFGAEGLTQYINYLQFGDVGEDMASQFQQRKQAEEFLRKATSDGKTPTDVTREFIVGSPVSDIPHADIINELSYKHNLSPALVAGLLSVESNFNPRAVNPRSGAGGMPQFMPTTAREAGLRVPDDVYDLDVQRLRAIENQDWGLARDLMKEIAKKSKMYNNSPFVDERFDPDKAIPAAIEYLGRLKSQFGDEEMALAGYNAGPGNVRRAIRLSEERGGDWKEYLPQDETREYIPKIFTKAEEYGTNHFTYEELAERDDITFDIPHDWNPFTSYFYAPEGSETIERDFYGVSETLLRELAPEQHKERFDMFLDPNVLDKPDGEYTKEYGQLLWGLLESSRKESLGFGINDLVDTVKANALMVSDDEENPEWLVAVDNLSPHARLAFDVLSKATEYKDTIEQTRQDGILKFRPNIRQVRTERIRDWVSPFFRTQDRVYRNEEGNLVTETRPAEGFINGTINTLSSVGLSAAQGLTKYFFEPSVRHSNTVLEELGAIEGNRALFGYTSEEFSQALKGYTDIGLMEIFDRDTHGTMPMVAGGAMEFVNYIGAAVGAGAGLVRLGAGAMGALTGAKTATDVARLANAGQASRWHAMSAKLNQAVGKGFPWAVGGVQKTTPWVTGGPVIYAGAASIEATQPEERSFWHLVPQLIGQETHEVRQFYDNLDRSGKVIADIGASLMLDGIFDMVLRGGVYGAAKIGQRFGREKFASITYNPTKQAFDVVDKPMFRHDLRVFLHNMFKDLDDMPIGAMGEVYAEPFNYSTLSQFTKVFVDNVGEFASPMRRDIEDSIRNVNRTLGDGRLTREQISELADQQYNEFLNISADRLQSAMKEAGDMLPLKFANTLEQSIPTIREFNYAGDPIHPSQIDQFRAQGYNLMQKDGRLWEIDPNFWTVDLAEKIRMRSLSSTFDDMVERQQRAAGIPVGEKLNEQQAQQLESIRGEVREILGRKVDVDGQEGYIVDIQRDGYVVRTSDGDRTVSNVNIDSPASELDRQGLIDGYVSARLDRLQQTQDAIESTSGRFSRLTDVEEEIRNSSQVVTQSEQPIQPQRVSLIPEHDNPFQSPFVRGMSSARQQMTFANIEHSPRTIDDLMGRNVRYGEYEGILRRDVENNIVVDRGRDVVEVPVMKRGDISLDDIGITPQVLFDADYGGVIINNRALRYREGMKSFNYRDGQLDTVTLRAADGSDVRITDPDLVNELYLGRISSEEGMGTPMGRIQQQINQHVNNNTSQQARRLLDEYSQRSFTFAKQDNRLPYC